MLCNLANFILVNWELEVGQGDSGGRTRGEKNQGRKGERKKESSKVRQPEQVREGVQGRSVTTITDPAMSSYVQLAQSLCRYRGSNEDLFLEEKH